MPFVGPWTRAAQRDVDAWCRDLEPILACADVAFHQASVPATIGLPRRLVAGDDAFQHTGEMVMKRELVRPVVDAALHTFRQRFEEARERAARRERVMAPSDQFWAERLAALPPDGPSQDDVYEVVAEHAAEVVAGTTIGHRRGGPGMQHEKRIEYYAARGFEEPLVKAMERAVQRCRVLRDDSAMLVTCAVEEARRGVLDASIGPSQAKERSKAF